MFELVFLALKHQRKFLLYLNFLFSAHLIACSFVSKKSLICDLVSNELFHPIKESLTFSTSEIYSANHSFVFLKPDSSIIAKNQNFIIPSFSSEIHHEVELVVKINKVGKHIDESFSNKYYNEIGLGIDFTARDIQNNLKQKGHPWEKSKAFDNSCLVGEFIVKDELENQSNIEFSLKKNNLIVQSGSSSQMLWKIDELISYVSQYFTLKIGDLIFTGTPAGVSKIISGDLLEGYINSNKMFSLKVK